MALVISDYIQVKKEEHLLIKSICSDLAFRAMFNKGIIVHYKISKSIHENEHIILTGIEKLKRIDLLTMINEIMQNKLTIKQVSNHNMGHYKITPYTFHPTVAKKLVANPYIDLGQGLLECIQTISSELDS